ncbi:MAG: YraN family protein [Candidatus Cyclobacteriaceae bacterium M2_1C_046]
MKPASNTGKEGEKLAAEYMIGKGYEILEENFRYKRGEIDLIAQKDQLLVFVEVKARTNVGYGHPEESVDNKKAEMIIKTADQYLLEKDWQGLIRFDIISIYFRKTSSPDIMHFEDAFY